MPNWFIDCRDPFLFITFILLWIPLLHLFILINKVKKIMIYFLHSTNLWTRYKIINQVIHIILRDQSSPKDSKFQVITQTLNKQQQQERQASLIANRSRISLIDDLVLYSSFWSFKRGVRRTQKLCGQVCNPEKHMEKFWKKPQRRKLFASAFVSCIIALLSPIGAKDSEAWVGSEEVSPGKVNVRNNKETLRDKFWRKFSHLNLVKTCEYENICWWIDRHL